MITLEETARMYVFYTNRLSSYDKIKFIKLDVSRTERPGAMLNQVGEILERSKKINPLENPLTLLLKTEDRNVGGITKPSKVHLTDS